MPPFGRVFLLFVCFVLGFFLLSSLVLQLAVQLTYSYYDGLKSFLLVFLFSLIISFFFAFLFLFCFNVGIMYTIAITKSYNNLHQPIVAEVQGKV